MNYSLKPSRCFLSIPILAFIIILISSSHLQAQMFSVEEEERIGNRALTPSTGVYIGLEPAEFTYEGDFSGLDSGIYQFDGPLMRLRFESFGFEAFLGVGGRLTGIDDIGYFDAGAKAVRGIRIVSTPRFQLQIPLQIKSSITTVSNNESIGGDTQFRQGTLEFGGGGQMSARLGERVRFTVAAIPNYGFSFASGGIFGGQIYELETKTRIYIDRVFGDLGLSAGWDYGFKRFDVEEEEFDYNLRSYSFIIGITF